jgi:hypothetical protein
MNSHELVNILKPAFIALHGQGCKEMTSPFLCHLARHMLTSTTDAQNAVMTMIGSVFPTVEHNKGASLGWFLSAAQESNPNTEEAKTARAIVKRAEELANDPEGLTESWSYYRICFMEHVLTQPPIELGPLTLYQRPVRTSPLRVEWVTVTPEISA